MADEPTGSLDAANRETIIALLKNLNHEGKTVFIATHDETVSAVCDRIIVLSPA